MRQKFWFKFIDNNKIHEKLTTIKIKKNMTNLKCNSSYVGYFKNSIFYFK